MSKNASLRRLCLAIVVNADALKPLFPASVSLPTIAMSRAMPVTGKPLFHWHVREIAPQNKHCNAMSNVWPNPSHT
uniref:Uncharacterized protein n=1 Tax=Bracon brevicornis TaxID=1563983 RepID=A0A6V7KCH4_9HYME